eukprot:gene58139-biopygen67632
MFEVPISIDTIGVYCVVLNLKRFEGTQHDVDRTIDSVRFWLRSIYVHTRDDATGSSPVLLVGTHVDELDDDATIRTASHILDDAFACDVSFQGELHGASGGAAARGWADPVLGELARPGSEDSAMPNGSLIQLPARGAACGSPAQPSSFGGGSPPTVCTDGRHHDKLLALCEEYGLFVQIDSRAQDDMIIVPTPKNVSYGFEGIKTRQVRQMCIRCGAASEDDIDDWTRPQCIDWLRQCASTSEECNLQLCVTAVTVFSLSPGVFDHSMVSGDDFAPHKTGFLPGGLFPHVCAVVEAVSQCMHGLNYALFVHDPSGADKLINLEKLLHFVRHVDISGGIAPLFPVGDRMLTQAQVRKSFPLLFPPPVGGIADVIATASVTGPLAMPAPICCMSFVGATVDGIGARWPELPTKAIIDTAALAARVNYAVN